MKYLHELNHYKTFDIEELKKYDLDDPEELLSYIDNLDYLQLTLEVLKSKVPDFVKIENKKTVKECQLELLNVYYIIDLFFGL